MNEKGLPTLKICEQKLNYLNYSPRTKENYLGHISRFITSQMLSKINLPI
jgi:hypothetical protein